MGFRGTWAFVGCAVEPPGLWETALLPFSYVDHARERFLSWTTPRVRTVPCIVSACADLGSGAAADRMGLGPWSLWALHRSCLVRAAAGELRGESRQALSSLRLPGTTPGMAPLLGSGPDC